MRQLEGKNAPIFSWCENIEESALAQAFNLSTLPFIFNRVCLMPDCHTGYGMPIGGVIATKDVVIPNAVGVDIGCGMCAVKTSLKEIDIITLKQIMSDIRARIPLGFEHHKEDQIWRGFEAAPDIKIIMKEINSAKKQIGTLGGGNHFIEIQKGSDGFIWIMIHSGSRNFGYRIAKEYNKIAQDLCKKWYSNIPPIQGEDGLAFFPIESDEGKEYIIAMNYCLNFAKANRQQMINKCKESFLDNISCDFDESIDIHHNYATLENHFDCNVMVHRKGATSARKGQIGIIPGSQGSFSYITEGLGNVNSFMSCSHGAGRQMSRKKARETLDLETEIDMLDSQGIIHSIRNKKDLDEASSAYKNINEVMKEQEDLTKILIELKPLAVIKG